MDPHEPVRYLLSILDLEGLDNDTFRGRNGEGGGRLFGGLVAAQALRAAQLTVAAAHRVNSVHSYFLRPGRYGTPVVYAVDRIRDGGSFSTRRVVARQTVDGEATTIFNLEASFHRDEPGDEYQAPALVDLAAVPADAPPVRFEGPRAGSPQRRPFEMREADLRTEPEPARAIWIRATDRLPDDPALHACVITFLSDMGPVMAVRRRLASSGGGRGWPPFGAGMTASLDHCLWFHRPARADEWLLYRLDAVAAAGARGVAQGELWTADGALAVSVVQEALVRPPRS